MEASGLSKNAGGKSIGNRLSTRRGGLTVAAVTAVLAGVLIYAFVHQYKNSVNSASNTTPVFVASGFLPRGTPASVVGSGKLLQRTSVKANQVQAGAIADPAVLHGEVAVRDIYPGQQITLADFAHGQVTIASQLSGTARAVAIPVDSSHGLVGFVQTGDHVDILTSVAGAGIVHPAVTTLAQNVLVLSAPSASGGGGVGGGGGNSSNVVLSVTDKLAVQLAFAADNGKVWVTLRPPVGSLQSVGSTGH